MKDIYVHEISDIGEKTAIEEEILIENDGM